jgi:uncharacterized protein (TIGR02266 family)
MMSEPHQSEHSPSGIRRIGEERRFSPRIPLQADVVLACGSQFFSGTATDLSARGVFVATRRPLDIGTNVSLELTVPEGQVLARGVVRWRRAPDADGVAGVGIELVDLSDLDVEIIAKVCGTRPRFITYDEVRAAAELAESA